MSRLPSLIPIPRRMTHNTGTFTLPPILHLVMPSGSACDLFAAQRFIEQARPLTPCDLRLTPGPGIRPAEEIRALTDEHLLAGLPQDLRRQAYRLRITPAGITLTACAAPGTFYAFQTLLQIFRHASMKRRQAKSTRRPPSLRLACLDITDYPDFARRGFYHDTARGKVPTVETLLQLIDDLADLKYNEFQLYIENNFEFRKHPAMYDDTTPFSAGELIRLDAACRARHIDFVPSLSSLGHFEKILSRRAYRHLAEAEPSRLKALGLPCPHEAGPWSLCTTDPRAKALLKDMYDEFLPNFSSPRVNICCDEAYDLGSVRSGRYAATHGGAGPLFLEWILLCDRLAQSHGKSIQLWGDMLLKYPDLIGRLPAGATVLEWGYEADHPFDEHCRLIGRHLGKGPVRSRGSRAFYVCPGTSSWLSLAGRSNNALANIHKAATVGLKQGAAGFLLTDWGDRGHQNFLAISLVPLAWGAAASWNTAATPSPLIRKHRTGFSHLLKAIAQHLLKDPRGTFAALAFDLGLTYERFSWQRKNASLDFLLFREPWNAAEFIGRVRPGDLTGVLAACRRLLPAFRRARLMRPDGDLVRAEMLLACRQIIHTCLRTELRQSWLASRPPMPISAGDRPHTGRCRPLPRDYAPRMRLLRRDILGLRREFSALWRARNKPSRLADVQAEFQRRAAEYRRFAR